MRQPVESKPGTVQSDRPQRSLLARSLPCEQPLYERQRDEEPDEVGDDVWAVLLYSAGVWQEGDQADSDNDDREQGPVRQPKRYRIRRPPGDQLVSCFVAGILCGDALVRGILCGVGLVRGAGIVRHERDS